MAFTIPNESVATYPPQAAVDSVDFDAFVLASQGTGWLSGCAVSVPAVAGRTVDVAAGRVAVAGKYVAVGAVASLAIAAASATDRKDIVVVNGSGTVSVVQGTASAATSGGVTPANQRDPVKPAISANSAILAEIYVPAGMGNTAAGHIVDKRFMAGPGGAGVTQDLTSGLSASGLNSPAVSLKTRVLAPQLIHFHLNITAGTLTASGTAPWVSLPTGMTGDALTRQVFAGTFNANVPILCRVEASGTQIVISHTDVTGAALATGTSYANVKAEGVLAIQ